MGCEAEFNGITKGRGIEKDSWDLWNSLDVGRIYESTAGANWDSYAKCTIVAR